MRTSNRVKAFVITCSLSVFLVQCTTDSAAGVSTTDTLSDFRSFVGQVPWMMKTMHLEAEQNFRDRFNPSRKIDSLWFLHHEFIVGMLHDTSRFFEIVYFADTGRPVPALRVFTHDGKRINDKAIGFLSDADSICTDSSRAYVRFENEKLYRFQSYREFECDSSALKSYIRRVRYKQRITVDSLGNIVFTDEIN